MDAQKQEIIAGRNAVIEALRSGRVPDTIYLAEGELHGSIGKVKALAREAGAVIKTASRKKLDELSPEVNHQGVVAICACASYATVEEILAVSKAKGTAPFLIIADEIEDPHNLGAILRTAEAAGADGVIIPKRRSASLTAAVYKTSAGAASRVKVARVPNLAACIRGLKDQGIWIYGAEMEGERFDRVDFRGAAALEKQGEAYLIADGDKNTITRMVPTGYVRTVREALAGYRQGEYARSEKLWNEVLASNPHFTVAYRSIGRALLADGDCRAAMEYLREGDDRYYYSLALQEYRRDFIRNNLLWLLPAMLAVLAGLVVGWRRLKRWLQS